MNRFVRFAVCKHLASIGQVLLGDEVFYGDKQVGTLQSAGLNNGVYYTVAYYSSASFVESIAEYDPYEEAQL